MIQPILFGMFCAAVVMTNAVSGNVIAVGPFVFVAGTLLYPVTFLLTDVLSEVYGKRVAQRAVWTGFAAQVIAVGFIQVVGLFPSVKPEMAAAFDGAFRPVARIVVASMAAYLVSQSIDVRLFHLIRSVTQRRHLWLRNNGSTIFSQAIDTSIFVAVAFVGELEWPVLLAMAGGQYVVKVLLAALDTPFCYLAVSVLRRLGEDR